MSKEAFKQAARFFTDAVARVRPNQWDDPALGIWTVRDLVGHTSRAITRMEDFVSKRTGQASVTSAAHHYHIALGRDGADDVIAKQDQSAGSELGDDPASVVRAAADRVLPVVENVPEDAIIAYAPGSIRFDHYLQTRVLELTVHTLDLLNAVGIEEEPPREALVETLHLLADLAADSGHGGKLPLAATGRGVLPDRFSVLG